jgi:hypothetical protein
MQCIEIGCGLQEVRDATPFSEDDFVAKMRDEEYLKIFECYSKNKQHHENAHYFVTLGGIALIAAKIGLTAIEEHSE